MSRMKDFRINPKMICFYPAYPVHPVNLFLRVFIIKMTLCLGVFVADLFF